MDNGVWEMSYYNSDTLIDQSNEIAAIKEELEAKTEMMALVVEEKSRLTEENAELREALVKNEEFITWLIENLPADVLDDINEPLSEATNRNLKLLNK